MKSFVLLITSLLTVWCAEVKASVFHLNQTVDQTVIQAVKEKNWKLKVDMAFLSDGKTQALPSDSCFMMVNGADATLCLPYVVNEQSDEKVSLQGKVTAYSFRDKGDHYTVNLHVTCEAKNYSFTIHVYKEDGLGSILLNSSKLSYSAELVK